MSTPAVPRPDDEDVKRMIAIHGLAGTPVILNFQDFGYQPKQCHLSAKHRAITAGGRRVHGRAIWRWVDDQGNTVILAEHHSVWENENGELIDVTPPAGGTNQILFIRDDTAKIWEVSPGVVQLRTDLSDIPECPFIFQGQPAGDRHWHLHLSATSVLAYCKKLNILPTQIVTDDKFG